MKKLFLILLILLAGCTQEFCGTSTYSECKLDAHCITAGCSSQICQSKSDEQPFTICEYKDCYETDLECKCVENQCQWN